MPPPKPQHLFDQAERLSASTRGRPLQTDLRRSVATAYYGLFHMVAAQAAGQWIPSGRDTELEYALVYRNVDHGRLKTVCNAAKKALEKEFGNFKGHKFGSDLRAVADAIVELQYLRNRADYDPLFSIDSAGARLAISRAKHAANLFWTKVPNSEKVTFLTLLMFRVRPH